MNEANPVPPDPMSAGLSVRVLSKPRVPRAAAGWKMVNSSRRISVPYFHVCRPRTQVRFSETVYEFCSSLEGRNVGLPKSRHIAESQLWQSPDSGREWNTRKIDARGSPTR